VCVCVFELGICEVEVWNDVGGVFWAWNIWVFEVAIRICVCEGGWNQWIFEVAYWSVFCVCACVWGGLECVNFELANLSVYITTCCCCCCCCCEIFVLCCWFKLLLLLLWGVCPLFLGYFTDTGFCCWKKLGLELGLAWLGFRGCLLSWVFSISLCLCLSLWLRRKLVKNLHKSFCCEL
jgi:hypothetical protein